MGVRALRWSVLGAALVTLAALAAVTPALLASGSVEWSVRALLGELRFRLDGVGLLCSALAALLWAAATLHAGAALAAEAPRRALRYHATALVTLLAIVTVFTAADLLTLYVGFEWLGISAYLFVVHNGSSAADAAGKKYLVLTLAGGFAVLTGALLVQALGGGDLATPLPLDPDRAGIRLAAALCLLLGFAVKAGALGVHTWLPDAHSAAPASASALLSGVMLKAGAYGIVRTLAGLFGGDAAAVWPSQQALGLLLLWWGVATMLVGVALALRQRHAKRLLAYSSVSQMGVVLAAIGAAAYLGDGGAVGWTGTVAHILTHGFAKGLLFLGVGAVISAAGSAEFDRLGGLARRLPWTFALLIIGAAALVGAPGTSGLVSKSVVHHALEYAAAHDLAQGGRHALALAERLFTLTSIGTAAVLVKLLVLTFLGRPRSAAAATAREGPLALRAALLVPATALLLVGVRPQWLEAPIAATLASWGLPSHGVAERLGAPLRETGDVSAVGLALVLGACVYVVSEQLALDRRPAPAWASLDAAALRLWRTVAALLFGAQCVAARGARVVDGQLGALRVPRQAEAGAQTLLARLGRLPAWSRDASASVQGGHGALRTRALRWLRGLLEALERWSQRLDDSWRLARDRASLDEAERERWLRSARRRINRHSRDVGLAMAALVLTWLLVLASLAPGALSGRG